MKEGLFRVIEQRQKAKGSLLSDYLQKGDKLTLKACIHCVTFICYNYIVTIGVLRDILRLVLLARAIGRDLGLADVDRAPVVVLVPGQVPLDSPEPNVDHEVEEDQGDEGDNHGADGPDPVGEGDDVLPVEAHLRRDDRPLRYIAAIQCVHGPTIQNNSYFESASTVVSNQEHSTRF